MADADCCHGTCVGGTCCSPSGSSCFDGSVCCGGLACLGGTCTACRKTSESCSYNSDCCTLLQCTAPQGGQCCGKVTSPCTAAENCCIGFACGSNGLCCQESAGTSCSRNEECCPGLTCEGVVAPYLGRCEIAPGGPCTGNDCASGYECRSQQCCGSLGTACSDPSSCCSRLCTAGTCACVPLNNAVGNCEDSACCDGAATCTGGKCCYQTMDACTSASQCCSGSCRNPGSAGTCCLPAGQSCIDGSGVMDPRRCCNNNCPTGTCT
jgi:hypothetical protein